ncbi:hypothetical protein ACFQH3_09830 [Haladaptatus sp. GCM10025707]|uniref:hypothetical protein n=1 Tax=unclassified Haladaptatus TaxID=2622732 RepID=UPI0023E8A09D|nr:hypothetical protein [Haladaptatus sp. QDMS2]
MPRQRSPFRFIYPERGFVVVALLLLLGYVLVNHTTGPLSRTLHPTYPSLFPEPVHTLALFVLAFTSIMALVGEGYRQYKANPRIFMSREEVRAFHSHERFDEQQYRNTLAMLVVVALVVVLGWSKFIVSYAGTVRVVAQFHVTGTIGAINPLNVGWGIVFLAGFFTFAIGLDWLVVALWRDLRFKLFKDRVEA